MKLELKYLAPYHEHKVKLLYKGNICNIAYLSTKRIAFLRTDGIGEVIKMTWEQTSGKIKLLLRPLSDLNELDKEWDTEHSINILIGENGNYGKVTINHYKGRLGLEVEPSNPDYPTIEYIHFNLIEKIRNILLKNHYDIFGLIKNDLAIDINTLTNA